MKIVFVAQWYSEKMGYSSNFLPKALAALGHDVHLITTDGQVYFNSPVYREIFEKFLGPPLTACGVKRVDGYTLHRLPHRQEGDRVFIDGLEEKLREIRPDIVQAEELICESTYQAAAAKSRMGFKMFVECHIHASVFNPVMQGRFRILKKMYWRLYRETRGRYLHARSEKCYPISTDAAEIAQKYWGFPTEKICVRSLGTDTELFCPAANGAGLKSRQQLRGQSGFGDSDIVCIYTGRLEEGKDPLCLARAVDHLTAQGGNFRALFVGDGAPAYVNRIKSCRGCVVHPFVPVQDLADLYRACDIGVWPKQESTSQLDAAACGLPLILSNRIHVHERVDGNGFLYQENDVEDLVRTLRLLTDADLRKRMGRAGVNNMRQNFSWANIARQYVQDYEAALKGKSNANVEDRALTLSGDL